MDTKTVGAALGAFALVAGGYFLAISPQMSSTAEVREEAETISAQAERTLATIPGLQAQLADITPQVAELRDLSTRVPPQLNLPDLYAELDAATAAAGIGKAENVTVSTPVLVTTEAPVADPAAAPEPVDPAAEPTEEGDDPAPTDPGAVIARYDVSLTITATPGQVSSFLGALSNSVRMNTITGTNITAGEDGRATIQAVFYLQQVEVDQIAQQIEDLANGKKPEVAPEAAPAPQEPAVPSPTE